MALTKELVAIRDNFKKLAQQRYTMTKDITPDGQYCYTVFNKFDEPVNSVITPDGNVTAMLVFGHFTFTGNMDGFLKGAHLREWNKRLRAIRAARAAGDDERMLHETIALDKLSITVSLNR